MGAPGGGSNMITGRFIRHMLVLAMDSFEDATLNKIFTSLMEWHFSKGFDDTVARLAKVFTTIKPPFYDHSFSQQHHIYPLFYSCDIRNSDVVVDIQYSSKNRKT